MGVMQPGPEEYGRMLFGLLPPSNRLWDTRPTSVLMRLLFAFGDELARFSARMADLLEESDPRTAVETLPEWEGDYGLPSTGTTAERQARLVSHILQDTGVRPVDFQEALAAILGLVPVDVVVLENSRAFAILVGDDRIIYQFYIYRNPALPGTYDIVEAQAILDNMAHAHTNGVAIESVNFLCDDPYSLCDRDLLGV